MQDDAQVAARRVPIMVPGVSMAFVMSVAAGMRRAIPVVVTVVPVLRPVPVIMAASGVIATVSATLVPMWVVVITARLMPPSGMDAILTPVLVVIMTLLAVLGVGSVVTAGVPGTGYRNRIIAGEKDANQ